MPDQRTPLPPRDPDRGDLRVEGAPKKPPMIPWSGRRFVAILLGLFVLNWLIVAVFAPAEERIRVPYNPTFLREVRDGNVKEISSRGETVQGDFRKEVKYKDNSAKGMVSELTKLEPKPKRFLTLRSEIAKPLLTAGLIRAAATSRTRRPRRRCSTATS